MRIGPFFYPMPTHARNGLGGGAAWRYFGRGGAAAGVGHACLLRGRAGAGECTYSFNKLVQVLRVEYVFTYTCDAATGIRIPYSAWLNLYMTYIPPYSR